ncbi:phage tail protein [Pseudomonas sp. S3_C01]
MIDANSQFFAILTNVGMAKQANADALGIPWKITEMGVGDANGTDPIPNASQTELINEWRRRPLNQLKVDPVNPAVIIAEQIIPADEGGKWIREIGLYDADGDLVAVANCAPSFKPVLSQGSGRTQVVRMNLIVSSSGNITLKIDPAVVLATREYVDQRIQEELYMLDTKQSVLVATTTNIALAGLQTIDGVAVPAGARVLVKNQTVAKDNGIYIAAAPAWARAPDADTNAEVTSALLTSVEQGSTLADTRWQLVTDGLIVVGTSALMFQNVTQGFAPINSPALINPTANTPPQFDASQLLINAAFAKRMGVEYSVFETFGISTVLGALHVGGVAAGSSPTPISFTLPTVARVPDGATVEVVDVGPGTLTVLASGTDVLVAPVGNLLANIVLSAGDNAEFVKLPGGWRLRSGSMALKYAAVMSGPNWITQPQFANDKSVATTEFVQRGLGSLRGFVTLGSSRTLTTADIGNGLYIGTNGTTLTLATPGSLGAPLGAAFTVLTTSASGTVVPGAGATINYDVPSLASLSIKSGQVVTFIAVSSTIWQVINSTAELKRNADFFASLGANGSQRLPSGLIFQWAKTAPGAVPPGGQSFPANWPTAFPNACFFASASCDGTGSTGNVLGTTVYNVALSGLGITVTNTGVNQMTNGTYYYGIGF